MMNIWATKRIRNVKRVNRVETCDTSHKIVSYVMLDNVYLTISRDFK